jgi:transcriptional regulator with XRE-family HTH domain
MADDDAEDVTFPFASLRKTLGLGQFEMAERMGLTLRPYQELEKATRPVKPRHIRLAESVVLDVAIEKQNLSLLPGNVREKVLKLALMLVERNLNRRREEIAKCIVGFDES